MVEIRKNEIIVWKKDSLESSDKNEECLKYDNRNFMDLNGIFEFVDSVNLSDIMSAVLPAFMCSAKTRKTEKKCIRWHLSVCLMLQRQLPKEPCIIPSVF